MYSSHPDWDPSYRPIPLDVQIKENNNKSILIRKAERKQGDIIVKLLQDIIENISGSQIGVCFPGIKDDYGVTILANGPRIPELLTRLNKVDTLYNDSDCCVLGEWRSTIGKLQNTENFVYIGGGTGVMNGMTSVRVYADSSSSVNNGGNQVARFDSDGLKFGTDTAAANALDDYEEGTWTPSYRYGANVTTTGNSNGEYVRIGNLVYIRGYLQNSYVAGGQSWQADIAGLPFTPNSGGYGIYAASAFGTNWSYNSGYYGIIACVNEGHASVFLRANNAQGHNWAPTAYNMTNTTSTYIAGCYHTLGF